MCDARLRWEYDFFVLIFYATLYRVYKVYWFWFRSERNFFVHVDFLSIGLASIRYPILEQLTTDRIESWLDSLPCFMVYLHTTHITHHRHGLSAWHGYQFSNHRDERDAITFSHHTVIWCQLMIGIIGLHYAYHLFNPSPKCHSMPNVSIKHCLLKMAMIDV